MELGQNRNSAKSSANQQAPLTPYLFRYAANGAPLPLLAAEGPTHDGEQDALRGGCQCPMTPR